jgi:hypothetical protein
MTAQSGKATDLEAVCREKQELADWPEQIGVALFLRSRHVGPPDLAPESRIPC